MSTPSQPLDVVVVGAGLVGLAATAMLAQHGVRVLAVDRHESTSTHPKARLVNARSMELYRWLGVDAEIMRAGEPNSGFVVAETLADEHFGWIPPTVDPTEDPSLSLSPCESYSCDQQRIEPILLGRAEELGAEVRFGTTASLGMVGPDGVDVELNGVDGPTTVRAGFVVAADGASSQLRESLGVSIVGEQVDGTAVSVVFDADLTEALQGRAVNALMARAAEAFLFARGSAELRSWQLGTHLRPGWEKLPTPELEHRLVEVIRAAVGVPDLQPRLGGILCWTTGAYVASQFRSGRVFFAGDSAHLMPPYGGFGGNTGVQDAHNLAWKLAAVCRGAATESLLDTYQAERKPIAELTVAQALLRSRKQPGEAAPPDQIDTAAIVLGFQYPAPGPEPAEGVRIEEPDRPSGLPGTRAPHLSLCDGQCLYDLLDPTRFTYVHAADSQPEPVARNDVHVVAVPVEAVAPEHQDRWRVAYARPDTTGTLIRPDGIIAANVASPGDLDKALPASTGQPI